MDQAVASAIESISKAHGAAFPQTVLILGSGLGRFGEQVKAQTVLAYDAIAGFPVSTVPGHQGRLLIGEAGGAPLAVMQGRLHVYEGHPIQNIAVPIRAFRALGAKTLIVTNAAGSLRENMGPGSLMIIEDHINFSGRNPLIGPNDDETGPRFPDMSTVYDEALRAQIRAAGEAEGVSLDAGVYLYTTGPSFETPAEIRMFARLGADAVGMSTVPEAIVARHCGLRVVGLSLITNHAAGIAEHPITHKETLEEGEKAYAKMSRLMLRFLATLG